MTDETKLDGQDPDGTGAQDAPKDTDDAKPKGDGSQADPKPNEDEAHDPEKAAKLIAALREDKRKAQERAQEAADKLAAIDRDKLTEEEKRKADLKAAEERADKLAQENRELKVDGKFRTALIDAGIPAGRLRAAKALVDLDVDDDGQITNLADAIETLKTDHAYLLDGGGTGGSGGGTGKVPPKEGSGNAGDGTFTASNGVTLNAEQLAMAKAAKISPEKYAAHL